MPSGGTNNPIAAVEVFRLSWRDPIPTQSAVESTAICRAARIDLNFANSYKAMPNFI